MGCWGHLRRPTRATIETTALPKTCLKVPKNAQKCPKMPKNYPNPHQRASATRVAAGAGAGADDDWRSIVGSEANLRQYLGSEGFRYCLNKTPEELEKEGACVRYSAGIGVVGMGRGRGWGVAGF